MDTVRLDFSINPVSGGVMDMDSFMNGNKSPSPMSAQYLSSFLTDVDYKHLSNFEKADLIDETNAHLVSKNQLKEKKLIGFVKGNTVEKRQNTLNRMQAISTRSSRLWASQIV